MGTNHSGLAARIKVGLVDMADMIYVRSEFYAQRSPEGREALARAEVGEREADAPEQPSPLRRD